MTYKNNYNSNKHGHDIEISLLYDVDISQDLWDESFKSIDGEKTKYGHGNVYVYVGNSTAKPRCEIDELFKIIGADKDIEKACEEYPWCDWFNVTEVFEYCNAHLNKLESIDAMNEELKEFNLSIEPIGQWQIIEIRGYNQGDYNEVLVDIDAIETTGTKFNYLEFKKEFEHIFYDSIINGVITVNGDEYYYEGDCYEFERDTWLNYVAEKSGVSLKELCEICPEYPGYN